MSAQAERQLAAAAEHLVSAVEAALADWVVGSVMQVAAEGRALDPQLRQVADEAGRAARAEIVPALTELLRGDPDEQSATPLQVLRGATRYPTEVLASARVPPRPRDRDAQARFPDDVYDLVPSAFADFGPEVAEAGLVWGAARALVHQARHGTPEEDQEIDDR